MPQESPHAQRRRAQRSVSDEQITFALTWGHEIPQRSGRTAWHVGEREIQAARRAGERVPERVLGLAAVTAEDGTLVTVVRSPDRGRLKHVGKD